MNSPQRRHPSFATGAHGAGACLLSACVLLIAWSAATRAQVVPAPTGQAPAAAAAGAATPVEKVPLTAGRSTVLATEFDITRIAVTNPAIADAVVVQPREVLIDGKSAGTVSLIIWGATRRAQYDVVVEPAITTLQQRLHTLYPGEDIQVSINDEAIVLSGRVSNTAVMLKAGEIAQASSAKAKVVNLLQLPGGQPSQQVMLQVRFAEVNRRAVTQLGANFFTSIAGFHNNLARSTTQQFAAPNFDFEKGGLVFSDFLNLFLFNTKYDLGAVIQALKSTGHFQSLAEPNLIAYNGQEASFLAGGEFPIPIVQGISGQVTIVFKEFGIRLKFTPTIAGDVIRLHVMPEVSTLDFTNGIILEGFRIPALSTRRAETEVELRDGQSFAIAGLLDNLSQNDGAAIPVLSSLPVVGNLFKSKADKTERTELMVLITPQLVRPLEPDEVPSLPTDPKRFLPRVGGIGGELEGGAGLLDAPKKPVEKPKPVIIK